MNVHIVAVFDISKKVQAESRNKLVRFMPTLKESAFFVDIKICTIFAVREPAKPLNNAKIGGSFFSYN